MNEDGTDVQIKISLTCAKDIVNPGDDTVLPGNNDNIQNTQILDEVKSNNTQVKLTDEEKANVRSLLDSLGL